MMRAVSFLVVPLAMTLTGCATIAHGTTQSIPITSSPQGARVVVDSVAIGVTPLVATVSRKQAHVVSVVHDSFPPVRVVMDRNVSPWVAASLFLYGFPAIVDFSNGAAYGFSVDTLCVNLAGRSLGAGEQPSEVHLTKGISGASMATATAASVFIGFGVGQMMVGRRAKPFFLTQVAGGTAAFTGLAMGVAGVDGGAPLFVGGAAVLIVSRAWEIADMFDYASKQNRPVLPTAPTPVPRRDRMTLSPVFDVRSKGVALLYTF